MKARILAAVLANAKGDKEQARRIGAWLQAEEEREQEGHRDSMERILAGCPPFDLDEWAQTEAEAILWYETEEEQETAYKDLAIRISELG